MSTNGYVPEPAHATTEDFFKWFLANHKIKVLPFRVQVTVDSHGSVEDWWQVHVERLDGIIVGWTGVEIVSDRDDVNTAITYIHAEYGLHGLTVEGWDFT